MKCRYIAPANLRECWSWVRSGLEKVIAKGHDSWIPEDIYCDCFEQRSMLWVTSSDLGDDNGFMILQPVNGTLHIWAAWLDSEDENDLANGLEHAKNIARQGGCTRITMSSVRKGWHKKASQIGFKPYTWELGV
jgi:hypothetical protein